MTGVHEDSSREATGRVLGWVSGLGLLVVPWIVAGVLATAAGVAGQENWNPEVTFPWFLLAAFLTGLGWIGYGCARMPGFRRGALPGTAIALTAIAGIYLATLVIGS